MILTTISIKRPVAMMMVIIALIIFGVVGFLSLPIDLMPKIEFPFVTVQAIYAGAGPEEIENSVVKPVEEELSTVSNVKNIQAFALEGVAFLFLEFNLGVDPDIAAIDVKDKIDAILYKLPKDLKKPVISKFDMNDQSIIDVALTGQQPSQLLREIAEKQVKERLVKINGVAQISIVGGKEREIQINLHKERMDALNLNIQTIAGILSAQTADFPGGHVIANSKEYTVRMKGQFESLDEIRNCGIPVVGNKGVYMAPLHTVADVVDAFKEVRELARYNGENSIGLSVFKRSDANIVNVAKSILKTTDELNKSLPAGAVINVANNNAEFIESSVNDMYINIAIGILLTAFMLLLFLGDWRVTIIAALTIPASILITFVGMQISGFTLNMITLISIAISIGTLVTNAIIVLENIIRHRDTGMPVKQAAEIGAKEVGTAVMASALTNIAVFVPMANMSGITGQIFKSLGLTIVYATVASLFLSFTFVPLLAAVMLKSKNNASKSAKGGLEAIFDVIGEAYARTLGIVINLRILVTLFAFAALFATFWFTVPRLGFEMFPHTDEGVFTINLEMPSGSSLEVTNQALMAIEKRINTIPEVKSMNLSLGGEGINGGVNIGLITVKLKDKKERNRLTKQIVNEVRPLLADIPDAKIVVKESSSMGGGNQEADLNVEVTGDDMEEILKIADSVKNLAQTIPGLVDFQLSWKAAKPEIKFIPNRFLLDEYGMQVAMLGLNLRNSINGNEDLIYREKNDDYPIRIQYAEKDKNTIDAVENVSIPTSRGIVPAKTLADVRYEGGASNINRKNRQRLVSVYANVSSGASGSKAAELQKLTDKIELPSGYKINYGGMQEMMNDSFRSLFITMVLAIILTFIVLAGSIESLTQPILIMITIPMGFAGVLWGLYLSGNSISMVSLMSSIMLIGVVVNNAILIIDYAHKRQREGLSQKDAIIDACKVKFSAIMMMNLAIVLSMLPQAFNTASIQSPFAVSAIGGIAVSTVMTLYVIPAMYMFTSPKKNHVAKVA
ncbi:MAG: efflux RND transporter permease subunit [Chitinispirillaceae bacterium]|nr:efflux RND transporter permease subunit [Chitinispirillaceae bacterium]